MSCEILRDHFGVFDSDGIIIGQNDDFFSVEIIREFGPPFFCTSGIRCCGNAKRFKGFDIFLTLDDDTPVRRIDGRPVIWNGRYVSDSPVIGGSLHKFLLFLRVFESINGIEDCPVEINVIIFCFLNIAGFDEFIVSGLSCRDSFSEFNFWQIQPFSEDLLRILDCC